MSNRKIHNVFISSFVAIVMIAAFSMHVFAVAPSDTKYQPLQKLSSYGVFDEASACGYEDLSEVKTETQSVYLTNAGDYLGTVTISYQTMIQGGRPQFAYDTVYLGYDVSHGPSYYAISYPIIDYSGDKITVTFTAQFGILYDEAVAVFTPY